MFFTSPFSTSDTASGGGSSAPTTRIDSTDTPQSGTVTVPTGATALVVKAQAPGGGGAIVIGAATAHGGGAGAYVVTPSINVTGEDSETITWTMGATGQGAKIYGGPGTAGGAITVTASTLANWPGNITANGGSGGTPFADGAGGTGTAAGSTVTAGGAGTITQGGASGYAPTIHAAIGMPGRNGGGGGPGHWFFGEAFQYQGGNGGPGFLIFEFT